MTDEDLARLRDLAETAPASVVDDRDRAAIRRVLDELARLEAEVARLTPPEPPPSTFAQELATYRAVLPHLLGTLNAEGRYAVFQGVTCLGVERTYEDALSRGYDVCGLTPFLVKRVEAVERALVMRPG